MRVASATAGWLRQRPVNASHMMASPSRRKSTCCLLMGVDQPNELSCPVREASWTLYSAIREEAQRDVFFSGCEGHVSRHLFRQNPQDLARLAATFSQFRGARADAVLRRLLWRPDSLVRQLKGAHLVRLLAVYAARDLREHDPDRPDLFYASLPHLTAAAASLGATDIGRLAALCRQFNLRDAELFAALGSRLVQLLQKDRHVDRSTSAAVLAGASRSRAPPAVAAAMSLLAGCGRLNIEVAPAARLFELVGPVARKTRDLGRMTALAQLAAKLGFGASAEAQAIWRTVHGILNTTLPASSGDGPVAKGYASQVVYGQLLLALVFDEAASAARDRALVVAVQAVHASFGASPGALDERLSRQLQVAALACRLERPAAWSELQKNGFDLFFGMLADDNGSLTAKQLTKVSSQQHLQVSGALGELGVIHSMEEMVAPYVADVRIDRNPQLLEIDGPMHFVGKTSRYDLKSSLKHRLLSKQGWRVYHIAWNDWPSSKTARLQYLSRLFRLPPPSTHLTEYESLECRQLLKVDAGF